MSKIYTIKRKDGYEQKEITSDTYKITKEVDIKGIKNYEQIKKRLMQEMQKVQGIQGESENSK